MTAPEHSGRPDPESGTAGPFTLAVVRCRHPQGCPAERIVPYDTGDLAGRLGEANWSAHPDHGWICPRHSGRPQDTGARRHQVVVTARTRALIQAIDEGHDFGLAIMRETGLSESTVYATLRRLSAAGWTVCELEPAEPAVRLQRPRRKIYRLADGLLDELGRPH